MSKDKPAERAAQLIDARIAKLDDWRGAILARMRALIKAAVPDVSEDWKSRRTGLVS